MEDKIKWVLFLNGVSVIILFICIIFMNQRVNSLQSQINALNIKDRYTVNYLANRFRIQEAMLNYMIRTDSLIVEDCFSLGDE